MFIFYYMAALTIFKMFRVSKIKDISVLPKEGMPLLKQEIYKAMSMFNAKSF